jgi:tetratricopeptide (TPR) repeat protein/transcriptional regulator with XRE-family HTH domain
VAGHPGLSFAELLRQLRVQARLTQEELAEAAGVSSRTISDLERGVNRTAQKETARLLAAPLGLNGAAGELFVAAARARVPAGQVLAVPQDADSGAFAAAATRTLPRDISSFTGRQAELGRLLAGIDGLAAAGGVIGIHAIDGMAGIGKTTLAVHAAHQLAGHFPDGQFFLPLHGHTSGRRPVDPADALVSLLLAAGVAAQLVPPGLEARAARWRDQVAGKTILLLLDDAAGHDQVAPLLPGTAGSLVILTSRRRLTALQDVAVISLDTPRPNEAATLLARLVDRAEINAGDAAVREVARLCGYLPLAIGMVAAQLRHHPSWPASGLAADLAEACDRLAVMRAENTSVTAAFDLSYQDLSPAQQRLFRLLGLIPGPSIDAYAAAALAASSLQEAQQHLAELYDHHLLTEPSRGRYQLHDLLRAHAQAKTSEEDPVEAQAAVGRLLNYYLRAGEIAGRHFASWFGYRRPAPSPSLGETPDLSTLARAATWLESERPNLHAAADYCVTAGRHRHAVQIPAAISGFLIAFGHADEHAALQRTALAAALEANEPAGQAMALSELGLLAWMTGDRAAGIYTAQALALYRGMQDRPGQVVALNQLGIVHKLAGDYQAAIACHQEALTLAHGIGDPLYEADVLNNLGRAEQLAGDYRASLAAQQQSVALFRQLGNALGRAVALNDLGVVQRETGNYQAASASERESLDLFAALGNQPGQAVAINELGLIQQLTGEYQAAAVSHRRALELHQELGNRRGQAEALNNLGELSLRTSLPEKAREYHSQAQRIACDIGVPLEEARALEGIGRSHLMNEHPDQASGPLHQALGIYRRINAPDAQRVEQLVDRYCRIADPSK